MLTHKEVNKLVANLAGDAEVFICNDWIYPKEDRSAIIKIQSFTPYSTDLMSAIDAAKRIADKNNYTFVLTYIPQEGNWKASFGDYKDCAEYSGGNPAYCTCLSILQFMGKV